jgi:hypothetical protein
MSQGAHGFSDVTEILIIDGMGESGDAVRADDNSICGVDGLDCHQSTFPGALSSGRRRLELIEALHSSFDVRARYRCSTSSLLSCRTEKALFENALAV